MRSIEQVEKSLNASLECYRETRPTIFVYIDELVTAAKKYRSDAKHDRNVIRLMNISQLQK